MPLGKLKTIVTKALPLLEANHTKKYNEYVRGTLPFDEYAPVRDRYSAALVLLKLKEDELKVPRVAYEACALLTIDIKEVVKQSPEHMELFAEWMKVYISSGFINVRRPWIPVDVEIMLMYSGAPLCDLAALNKALAGLIVLLTSNYYAAIWDRFRGRISKEALGVVHDRLHHANSVLRGRVTDPAAAFNLCAPVTIDIKTALENKPSQRYLLVAWLKLFKDNGYTSYHPVYGYPTLKE